MPENACEEGFRHLKHVKFNSIESKIQLSGHFPVEKAPIWSVKSSMTTLNSEIFRIFELSEWNINLNSSKCRALKIISNDTKLEPISWELNYENPLFNFCVGVWVRGQDGTNFSHISKDAQDNFTSFDINVVLGVVGQIWFWMKNRPKK